MEYSAEDRYRIWLSNVSGIGPARFYRLMAECGSARAVWESLPDLSPALIQHLTARTYANMKAARDERRIDDMLEKLDRLQIEAVTTKSPRYPQPLMHIYDAPPVLYLKGRAPTNYDRRFGVVGSRHATYNGRRITKEISELLSENGVSIVSGMALGVDTEAHRGALAGKTHTVAVLGCGVDVVYPADNRWLYDQILDEGGLILSELPPGAQPLRRHFPLRNRIISGLCHGVLLVEGAENSGAMITIDYALEQNRDVFAVPGAVYSSLSGAPNQLISEGAIPVLSAESILSFYGWAESAAPRPTRAEVHLDDDEKRVVAELMDEPLSFDELIMQTMLPADRLNTLLTMLELRQLIQRLPGNRYGVNL
ncbi:MAG: DNA-processing protein DprA [Clostridia bacterium]|nr:DNA-processing protein DprA [Clostridia bacterium]